MASKKPLSSKSEKASTASVPASARDRRRPTSAVPRPASQNATGRGDSPQTSLAAQTLRTDGGDTVRRPRVAILIAEGVDSEAAEALYDGLVDSGAVPFYVGTHLGSVTSVQGVPLEAEVTFETSQPVLFEAVVVPGGKDHVTALCDVAKALDFLKAQHRMSKPILALQEGAVLVERAGLPAPVNAAQPDSRLFVGMHATAADALPDLVKAMALQVHPL